MVTSLTGGTVEPWTVVVTGTVLGEEVDVAERYGNTETSSASQYCKHVYRRIPLASKTFNDMKPISCLLAAESY